jgi:hypothetical protein
VAERREGEGREQRAVQQRCAREQALPAFAAYLLCLPVRPADTATYKRFADLAHLQCVTLVTGSRVGVLGDLQRRINVLGLRIGSKGARGLLSVPYRSPAVSTVPACSPDGSRSPSTPTRDPVTGMTHCKQLQRQQGKHCKPYGVSQAAHV